MRNAILAKVGRQSVPAFIGRGAPFRTKLRTHTRLKLLVIFPQPRWFDYVGADFGLTSCRREFQHASRQRAPFAPGA
jgi:hypothetical protein